MDICGKIEKFGCKFLLRPSTQTGPPSCNLRLPSGKDQAVKLSLPRASSLNENVDHSALLKLGATVSERVNRFDAKPGGEGVGFSKLQETRRIFEQRTLQVRRLLNFPHVGARFPFKTFPVPSAPGETSCHQSNPAEEGESVGLPGRPSGRGGPLQRLDGGFRPARRGPAPAVPARPRLRRRRFNGTRGGRQPHGQSAQCCF